MTRVLSDRDKTIADLAAQKEALSKAIEEAQTTSGKDKAAWDALRLQMEEKAAGLTNELNGLKTRTTELEAYQRKMEALKSYPDLLWMADTIPSIDDPDALKRHLDTLQRSFMAAATEKAKTLTQGAVPGPVTPGVPQFAYTTMEQWDKAMRDVAGTPEAGKVREAFRKWVETQ
jgi:hypothetical protein